MIDLDAIARRPPVAGSVGWGATSSPSAVAISLNELAELVRLARIGQAAEQYSNVFHGERSPSTAAPLHVQVTDAIFDSTHAEADA